MSNTDTEKPGCRKCGEINFHAPYCAINQLRRGGTRSVTMQAVQDSERKDFGSMAQSTAPKDVCPGCGLGIQSDKRTVRFASGTSPLHTFEVLLSATWCPSFNCRASESVTVIERHDPGSSPWKHNQTGQGVAATPYHTELPE